MLFRAEAVREKRRRISGAVILSQPLSLRALTGVFLLLTIAFLWFLVTFEFQRRESVRGFVTSSQGVVALRARNGGVLVRRFANTGDVVEKGAPLFEASTDIESSQGLTRRTQIETTGRRLAELDGQLDAVARRYSDRRAYLEKKRAGLESRLNELRDQITIEKEILALADDRLDQMRTLEAGQHVSASEVTQQRAATLESQARFADVRGRADAAANEIALLELELDALAEEQAKERSELEIRKYALVQMQLEQQAQSSYVVRAPVAGRISAFQGDTGQELSRSAPVVSVLPNDASLEAHLLAPSRAIGFLEVGARVNLLIDAYPYQKFGVQTGRVTSVSESAYRPGELNVPVAYRESVYKVVVALDREYVNAYGRRHLLQVDMTLTADLVIDRRSLLKWLFDPLVAARS